MPQSSLESYRSEQTDSKLEELKEKMREDDWYREIKSTLIERAFEDMYETISREEAKEKIAESLLLDSHTKLNYVHTLANAVDEESTDESEVAVAKRFFKQELVEVFIEEHVDLQKHLHKLKFKTDTDIIVEEDNGT